MASDEPIDERERRTEASTDDAQEPVVQHERQQGFAGRVPWGSNPFLTIPQGLVTAIPPPFMAANFGQHLSEPPTPLDFHGRASDPLLGQTQPLPNFPLQRFEAGPFDPFAFPQQNPDLGLLPVEPVSQGPSHGRQQPTWANRFGGPGFMPPAISPAMAQQIQNASMENRPRSVSWSAPSDNLDPTRRSRGLTTSAATFPANILQDDQLRLPVTGALPMPPSIPWQFPLPEASFLAPPPLPGMIPEPSRLPNEARGLAGEHPSPSATYEGSIASSTTSGSFDLGEGPSSMPFDSQDEGNAPAAWLPTEGDNASAGSSSSRRGRRKKTGTRIEPLGAICPFPGCGMRFPANRLYNIKAHVRSHSQERPFVCSNPDCNRSFSRKHDLQRHERTHTGQKPYICDSCGRGFPRSDALRRHWRSEPLCRSQLGGSSASDSQAEEPAAADPSQSSAALIQSTESGMQQVKIEDDELEEEEEENSGSSEETAAATIGPGGLPEHITDEMLQDFLNQNAPS